MVDLFAREIHMDPVDVRRKNLVPDDAFPYATPLGLSYDSGTYRRALEKVLSDDLRRGFPPRGRSPTIPGRRCSKSQGLSEGVPTRIGVSPCRGFPRRDADPEPSPLGAFGTDDPFRACPKVTPLISGGDTGVDGGLGIGNLPFTDRDRSRDQLLRRDGKRTLLEPSSGGLGADTVLASPRASLHAPVMDQTRRDGSIFRQL